MFDDPPNLAGAEIAKSTRELSIAKRVEMNITEMEERLNNLKRIQEILTAHPELQELLTLMRRSGL